MGEMRQRKDDFGHEFNNIPIVEKNLEIVPQALQT